MRLIGILRTRPFTRVGMANYGVGAAFWSAVSAMLPP
jgi:hypothetical protein